MEIPITHEQVQKAGLGIGGAILTGIGIFIKKHFSLSNRITVIETKLESYDERFDRIEADLQTIINHLITKRGKK